MGAGEIEIKLNSDQEAALLNLWAHDEHKKLLYDRIRAVTNRLNQASLLEEQGDARSEVEYIHAIIEFVLTSWSLIHTVLLSARLLSIADNPDFDHPAMRLPLDAVGNSYRLNLSNLLLENAQAMLKEIYCVDE